MVVITINIYLVLLFAAHPIPKANSSFFLPKHILFAPHPLS